MTDAKPARLLRLRDALMEFCDPKRVAAVIDLQERFTDAQLQRHRRFRLGVIEPDPAPWTRQASPTSADGLALDHAWKLLLEDFLQRVADEEVIVTGVQTKPELTTERRAIPATWVTIHYLSYEMDFLRMRDRHYSAIRVSRAAPPGVEAAPGSPTDSVLRKQITAEAVRDMTDDAILEVLEEYARRVVEEEGSTLQMPVKVSFIPIIRRKMEHRFKTGAALATLGAEAAALADWIKTKVSGHQTPTPRTIENELREDYRRLKP